MTIDYLNPPPLPKPALTPGSSPHDGDSVVEILRLVTDPAAHTKHLSELQEVKAAWAEIARERRELRRERALQADELKRLRAEFDHSLLVDKENHLSALRVREQKFAAQVAELKEALAI